MPYDEPVPEYDPAVDDSDWQAEFADARDEYEHARQLLALAQSLDYDARWPFELRYRNAVANLRAQRDAAWPYMQVSGL